MTSRRTERGKDPFFRTIRFVAGRWRRQWRLALAMAAGLVLIAAAELALPIFAGQMIDALADSARQRDAAARGRAQGVRRDPRPRRCPGGPALGPVQGHHTLHLAHDERRGARDLLARSALLDRLACQQLRRRHGAQAEPRHVGLRHAERHRAHGAVAVARRACRRDFPVRLALAADGARRRRRHRPLCDGHGEAVARLRHARDAAFQRMGQPPGRRAGRRGELQPCRQGVRRGEPRGRALWPRPGALADAHVGHLDQGHAHRHPAAGHPDDAAPGRDRARVAVLVAGRRDAGRRHLRAHGLWRDQRLPARHRPPCAQHPAVDQRPGGARRLP